MSFTGKKSYEWKIAFINAFNQMEQELKDNAVPLKSLKGLFQFMDLNDSVGVKVLKHISDLSLESNRKDLFIEIPYQGKCFFISRKKNDKQKLKELRVLKKEGMSIERFKEIQRKNEELEDKTFELNNQVLELNKRLESIGVCKDKERDVGIERLYKELSVAQTEAKYYKALSEFYKFELDKQ